MPVDAKQDVLAVTAEQLLNLDGILNSRWARQWLMAEDQHWPIRTFQFGFKPIFLPGTDKGRVSGLSWRTGFIPIQHNQSQVVKIATVISGFNSPRLEAIFSSQIEIKLVIPDDMNPVFMGSVELVSKRLVFQIGKCEIAKPEELSKQ